MITQNQVIFGPDARKKGDFWPTETKSIPTPSNEIKSIMICHTELSSSLTPHIVTKSVDPLTKTKAISDRSQKTCHFRLQHQNQIDLVAPTRKQVNLGHPYENQVIFGHTEARSISIPHADIKSISTAHTKAKLISISKPKPQVVTARTP